MRLKLVLLASLIAAVVGAGAAITIVIFAFSSLQPISRPGLLVAATYLLPVVAIFFASFFVYRHTARRRRLQAVLTVLISFALTITIFVVASMLTAPPASQPADPPKLQPVGALHVK